MAFRANQARTNQVKPSSRQPVATYATAHVEKVQRIRSENVQALIKQTSELDTSLSRCDHPLLCSLSGFPRYRACSHLAINTPSLAPKVCICDSCQLIQALDRLEQSTSHAPWPWGEGSIVLVPAQRSGCCRGESMG